MKQNKYPPKIDAELDLHGMTSWEATSALEIFLEKSRAAGHHRVRIITGKGLHSEGEPVLRAQAQEILQAEELSFVRAKIQEGGTGALIVTL